MIYGVFPLFFFASLIARRMPWWKWAPNEEWPVWAGLFGIVTLLWFGLLRTKRWAYAGTVLFGSAFAIACFVLSFRQENVGLGLFGVALGVLLLAYFDRLASAFESPAISPGVRWYQSLPEPIPGVSVDWGDMKNLRLSQIDLDGGFVLGSFPKGAEKKMPTEIMLNYRGSRVGCSIQVLTSLSSKRDSSWVGIGVEFKNTDRDTRKELSDFIEVLRGEGHVST